MDAEEARSTAVTLGKPRSSLFGELKGNHNESDNGKRSLLKSCISLNVDDWRSEGGLSPSPISLARKVTL